MPHFGKKSSLLLASLFVMFECVSSSSFLNVDIRPAGYNPLRRPTDANNTPTVVFTNIEIYSLLAVDEFEQVSFTTAVFQVIFARKSNGPVSIVLHS